MEIINILGGVIAGIMFTMGYNAGIEGRIIEGAISLSISSLVIVGLIIYNK